MVYWYNSTSFRDDLAWAASWMYRATRDADYLGDAYGFWDTHKMLEGDYDVRYLVRPPRNPPLTATHWASSGSCSFPSLF